MTDAYGFSGSATSSYLRAVPLLLGYAKIESTVQYLGVEVEDALTLSEQIEL